ncbi:TPA: DUF29 domain-containing protein [Yersinia enterocolitica]|uniref:DUF29 domain-containing protein n=1 Tax=Yersinia enterocolitica TaxID=630 RepID=UPI00065A88E0|nr:DUF29 domain-containing protein [Yersinia enterocolitica]CRY24988.1 Domain of uncharacterised function DUF29 [Yersinia enterocolitica]HDM8291217.1 DUF29 domain-containing protein [Yersinia enterocolitica]HDM8295346.1 DUF29 domain-containing protein [Yersinia enterocolitica]HDM8320331.1 DUF29 domain-containing protein [Yersinia enterocolitica]HDM8333158.1 DUF29 domain-containing protein [Yersinia enterocolitica]
MTNRYDTDFYGWTKDQADLLRSGSLSQLDTQNLLEEIESMGNSQRSELESRLEVLFLHLLKWAFQPSHRGRSWQLTIAEQRRKVARRLSKSPSLKRELDEMTTDAYGDAILSAARETGMDEKAFPKSCPWTFNQIMDSDFYPE